MEQQADCVTTAVPTAFTPAAPSHAVKPFSSNHVAASVDCGDSIIIVCALPAHNNTDSRFVAKRERRTFWAECASCKTKNKHSIEHLNCDISCPQCSETFKATEVSRPRNPRTATTENVHSGAIVTSPGTMVEPSKVTPTAETLPKRVKREITAETPHPKRVKRDINVTQAAGKHGGNIFDAWRNITQDEINRLLMSKGWNIVTEQESTETRGTMKIRSQPQDGEPNGSTEGPDTLISFNVPVGNSEWKILLS